MDRSYATQIALAPLRADDSVRVVGSLLPELASDGALVRTILDKAEGNPFFLEELERLDADLRDLTRLEFLHERSDRDERACVFKHALTQDVAHATLVAPRRRALHRRAAAALAALFPERAADTAPVLAHHYLEAEAWAEAAEHACRAASIAAGAWANTEALARYDQAIMASERAGQPAAERRALLEARATVHDVLGHFEPARADLEAAQALAESEADAIAQGRVLTALGALWGGHRDYARGLELTRRAVGRLEPAGDRRALADARAQLGVMLVNLVRMRDSRRELEAALGLFEELGDLGGQGRTLEMLVMNLQLSGDFDRAAGILERALPMLRATGDRRTEITALASESATLAWRRGLSAGLPSLRRGHELARSLEARGDEAFVHALTAELQICFGAFGSAFAEASSGLAIARELQHREWTAYSLGMLGRLHAECGDVAGARALHDEELALSRTLGAHIWIADALANLGQDLVHGHDLEEGRRHLSEAIDVAGECTEKVIFPLLSLGECSLRAGRADEALAAVARFRAECGSYLVLLVEARRLEAEAWLAHGRVDAAEAALRTVLRDAERFEYGPARWRAGLALAESLAARGRRDEARREAGEVLADLQRVLHDLPEAPLGRAFRHSELMRRASRLAASAATT